jgi:hypothetical protein
MLLLSASPLIAFNQSSNSVRSTGGIAAAHDFTAVPGNGLVDIYWNTSSEINVERFDIEYSADGNNYAVAGSLLAKGGISENEYHFKHNYLKEGDIYYRLRAVNFDGSFQYSYPVIAEYSDRYLNYNFVYPSTVRRGFPVKLFTNENFDRAEMISQGGTVLFKQNIKGMTGRFEIPATINSSGIYYVRLSRNDRSMIQRIVVTD